MRRSMHLISSRWPVSEVLGAVCQGIQDIALPQPGLCCCRSLSAPSRLCVGCLAPCESSYICLEIKRTPTPFMPRSKTNFPIGSFSKVEGLYATQSESVRTEAYSLLSPPSPPSVFPPLFAHFAVPATSTSNLIG